MYFERRKHLRAPIVARSDEPGSSRKMKANNQILCGLRYFAIDSIEPVSLTYPAFKYLQISEVYHDI